MDKNEQKRHLIYQIKHSETFIARGGEFPDSDNHWGCPKVIEALKARIKSPKNTYFFSGAFICLGSIVLENDEEVIKPSEFLNTVLFSDKIKFFRKLPHDKIEKDRKIIEKYDYVPHPANEIHYRVADVGISVAHIHQRPFFFSSKPKRHYFAVDNPQDYLEQMEDLRDAIEDGGDYDYQKLNTEMLKDEKLGQYFVLTDKTEGEDDISYTNYSLFDKFRDKGWNFKIEDSQLTFQNSNI